VACVPPGQASVRPDRYPDAVRSALRCTRRSWPTLAVGAAYVPSTADDPYERADWVSLGPTYVAS